MSGAVEINIEAGEWLDITTKEEILQNELSQLKEVMKKQADELEQSQKNVEELNWQKDSLSDALITLEATHEDTLIEKEVIETAYTKLQTTSSAVTETMEKSIAFSRNEMNKSRDRILTLECEVKDVKRHHDKAMKESRAEITSLSKDLDNTRSKLDSKETAYGKQKEEMTSIKKELKEIRSQLNACQKELANEKRSYGSCSKKLEVANQRLGTVAVLAEERKDDKTSNDRTIAHQKHMLEVANRDIALCRTQISQLRGELSASQENGEKLSTSLQATRNELDETNEAEKKLAKCLESKMVDLGEALKQNIELKASLDDVRVDLEESRENEEALQEEIEKKYEAHKRQLESIREALGSPLRFPFSSKLI